MFPGIVSLEKRKEEICSKISIMMGMENCDEMMVMRLKNELKEVQTKIAYMRIWSLPDGTA